MYRPGQNVLRVWEWAGISLVTLIILGAGIFSWHEFGHLGSSANSAAAKEAVTTILNKPPAVTPTATPAPPIPSVSGRYDVLVPSNVSLATAGTIITNDKGKVLFDLTSAHIIVATLSSAEANLVAKNPSVTSVQQEYPAEQFSCNISDDPAGSGPTGSPPTTTRAPAKASTPVPAQKVIAAVVDNGAHGVEVSDTLLANCSASYGQACTAPIEVSDSAPDGTYSNASIDNAIISAVDQGAKIINVSAGSCGDSNCTTGTSLSAEDLNMLEYVSLHGAVLYVASGNSPTYVNALSLPNPYSGSVVMVGGQDPNNPSQPDPQFSSNNVDVYDTDTTADGTMSGTSFAAPAVAGKSLAIAYQVGMPALASAVAEVKSNTSADEHTDVAGSSNTTDIANDTEVDYDASIEKDSGDEDDSDGDLAIDADGNIAAGTAQDQQDNGDDYEYSIYNYSISEDYDGSSDSSDCTNPPDIDPPDPPDGDSYDPPDDSSYDNPDDSDGDDYDGSDGNDSGGGSSIANIRDQDERNQDF